MDSQQRTLFNQDYTFKKYKDFLVELNLGYPEIPFRVAESPLFLTQGIKEQLLCAGDEIIQFIKAPEFKSLTDRAIPKKWRVPNENNHPHFLSLDFGLCEENGQIVPKLIELQGFPSLFGFQFHLAKHYQQAFGFSEDWVIFNNQMSEDEYFAKLKQLIVGSYDAREVVMLDYKPYLQKTAIDFYLTAKHLGIKILSIEEIVEDRSMLYYFEGKARVPIKRIYNRLIFDELESIKDISFENFDPRKDYKVEWITHPHWFYRISKFTMPFLSGSYVPETRFLSEVNDLPSDLENYVLKPLFSFAGLGVNINLKIGDVKAIKDPENWVLQRKVNYAPVILTPQGVKVKAEIRLMYLWEDDKQPELVMNLTRLSQGNMLGVRYNNYLDWVGGSIAFVKKVNH